MIWLHSISIYLGELHKVYHGNGGISDTLAEKLRVAELENPKGKYGIHEYGLGEFGLSGEELISKNQHYFDLYSGLLSKDPVR